MATVREQEQPQATLPERDAPEKLVLIFGTKATCIDGTQGRVERVTVNSDSRGLERIVLETVRPARSYVVPAKLADHQSGVLQVACSGPELTRYDELSVLEVLPASALPPCYAPWQPLKQLQVDLQNPSGASRWANVTSDCSHLRSNCLDISWRSGWTDCSGLSKGS